MTVVFAMVAADNGKVISKGQFWVTHLLQGTTYSSFVAQLTATTFLSLL